MARSRLLGSSLQPIRLALNGKKGRTLACLLSGSATVVEVWDMAQPEEEEHEHVCGDHGDLNGDEHDDDLPNDEGSFRDGSQGSQEQVFIEEEDMDI